MATSDFTYAGLEENDADLKKLQTWLEKLRKLDIYGATRAVECSSTCSAARALLGVYAQRAFKSHDENR